MGIERSECLQVVLDKLYLRRDRKERLNNETPFRRHGVRANNYISMWDWRAVREELQVRCSHRPIVRSQQTSCCWRFLVAHLHYCSAPSCCSIGIVPRLTSQLYLKRAATLTTVFHSMILRRGKERRKRSMTDGHKECSTRWVLRTLAVILTWTWRIWASTRWGARRLRTRRRTPVPRAAGRQSFCNGHEISRRNVLSRDRCCHWWFT